METTLPRAAHTATLPALASVATGAGPTLDGQSAHCMLGADMAASRERAQKQRLAAMVRRPMSLLIDQTDHEAIVVEILPIRSPVMRAVIQSHCRGVSGARPDPGCRDRPLIRGLIPLGVLVRRGQVGNQEARGPMGHGGLGGMPGQVDDPQECSFPLWSHRRSHVRRFATWYGSVPNTIHQLLFGSIARAVWTSLSIFFL